jgi:23S rRNA (guanosine2251-2'-O)-methyltransferase
MPGNSQRRGATRKRQGGNPTAGSGARRRKQLEGKGPTPKAEERPYHKAYRKQRASERVVVPSGRPVSRRPPAARRSSEWVAGRNAVVEALEAGLPASAMYVAARTERDARLRKAFSLTTRRRIPVLEVPRSELDAMTDAAVHQGLALKVPAYEYADPADLLERSRAAGELPLVVMLDKITDPRNLGAVVRSAAAFGAHGVVIPERRSASMTASAWKASAGAASRVPVARTVNLTRQIDEYQRAGLMAVGLDAAGAESLDELEVDQPLLLVVGAEGQGLSRLVRETCDILVRIPMGAANESLNAGVAAGIALYTVSRGRAAR